MQYPGWRTCRSNRGIGIAVMAEMVYSGVVQVAIYARVSTSDQRCEVQLGELRQYCAARGWADVAEYVDDGISGAKASRPALDRLMTDCRRRAVDVVVVWKLDRFGRSLAHIVQSIQELAALGVRFIATTQGIDTDHNSPHSRFLLHIFAAFAEMEREIIRERTVAGVRAARERGATLGRPVRLFRRDRVVEMREKGMSWREISAELGVPVTTIREAVRRLKGGTEQEAP
jgi:putative DNA-invertase from lambdoid prophage Rac